MHGTETGIDGRHVHEQVAAAAFDLDARIDQKRFSERHFAPILWEGGVLLPSELSAVSLHQHHMLPLDLLAELLGHGVPYGQVYPER